MKQPFVLMIEEDELFAGYFKTLLREVNCRVVVVDTLAGARLRFERYKDELDFIVVDGCLNPKEHLDTPPLVKEFRAAGFQRPIIANSANHDNNVKLSEAGCSHVGGKNTDWFRTAVRSILAEATPKP